NRDVAYERLSKEYDAPADFVDANRDEIKEIIAPAGLAESKSEYLMNAARYIVEERGGDTEWIKNGEPEEVHDELTSIKGVGHKTADVILLFSADADICPVDTHVDRLTHRLGVASDLSRKKTRERLIELRDECGVNLREAHVALISHGRETCKARNPECGKCVVEEWCDKVDVDMDMDVDVDVDS
ncbi:MAG: endonuclease III, partial [Halobacteria archaeon]|nr:endonuclease III [Halobacteria archaeon]